MNTIVAEGIAMGEAVATGSTVYPSTISAMGEPVATGSAIYPSSAATATAVAKPRPNVNNMKAEPAINEVPTTLTANAAVTALRQQDAQWPDGLCSAIADSVAVHPLRIVIMDNSGSMGAFDGRKLQKAADGTFRTVRCDRWEELTADLVNIANISETLGARTDLHLLNPIGWTQAGGGFGALSVATQSWEGGLAAQGRTVGTTELAGLLDRVRPSGTTPLTEAVMKVVSMVTPQAARLRAAGQKVAVLLCTDGLPNNKTSFVQAMRQLQQLPVWCVVRLCTNQDDVVEYWNDLDRSLESPLEVLDDIRGEAKEVSAKNPWLTYGPPLYYARLFGLPEKLFDVLDERTMAPRQIRDFVAMLLGLNARDLPDPELEQAAFLEAVRVALIEQPTTFDPKSGRMRPWIDLRLLQTALSPRVKCMGEDLACAIM
jgi:Mg-chelatase subunit ChlD